MEQRFGHDFGRVRMHADEEAASSARQLGAEAYTVGAHIYFGERRFDPDSWRGEKLLAHELTHVLQQTSSGRSSTDGSIWVQLKPKGKGTKVPVKDTKKKEPPVIIVDVGKGQKAVVKSEGKVVRKMKISSGKKGHPTDTGTFKITERDLDHASSKYGKCVAKDGTETDSDKGAAGCPKGSKYKGAPMPYFLRFNGPEGFHQGHVPNHPDSHGCVRLGKSNAKWLWKWTEKNPDAKVIVCKGDECPGAKKKPKTATPKKK
jgi:lipoprotein-anchoring transpeptidase ErfK/SrfK